MKNCILCGGSNLKKVVNYGKIYQSCFLPYPTFHSDCLLQKEDLSLNECSNCNFVQLNKFIEPDSMYRQYYYRSSTNASMVSSLKDIETNVSSHFFKLNGNLPKSILDIGCNDGTLLKIFRKVGSEFNVGFDPANNLASSASANCDIFINDYFNDKITFNRKFDVVTSIAMFYDIPKPDEFVKTVVNNLQPSGIWCIQMTDLMSMFTTTAFDNICHEHIGYYSLNTLNTLLNRNGMKIFDVSYNDVNGSSLRVLCCHKALNTVEHLEPKVNLALNQEKNFFRVYKWRYFNKNVNVVHNKFKSALLNFLRGKVYGIGASTKANTLLQKFKIDSSLVAKLLEVTPDKFGKFTPGSNIPIVSEAEAMEEKPECLVIFPWHFIDNFKVRFKDYLSSGGTLLVPLPVPKLITKDSEIEI